MTSRVLITVVALLTSTSALRGQALRGQALRELGRTAAGNPVLVEPRSVRREQSLVHATVRVRFAQAVKAQDGEWWSSRTRLTLDCSARRVKVHEHWYYGDTTWRRVVTHKVVGIPAFGTVLGGSMTSVSYDTLCPTR
jgi:hypothetical protein